jgi:hypothetical protein
LPNFSESIRVCSTPARFRGRSPNMDDAWSENIRVLVDKANQLIDSNRDRINELAKELAVPKAHVQPKGTRPEKGILLKLRTEAGV